MSASHKAKQRTLQLEAIENMKAADYNLFKAIEDKVGEITQWPLHLLTAMVSTHLTYQLRFQLTLFLLGNACPPGLMVEWYLQRKMLRDDSAHKHIANLVQEFATGKMEKWTTYVLPSKVTFKNSITSAEQKEMFKRGQKIVPHSYGNGAPPDATSAFFVHPVSTPTITDHADFQRAYALLAGTGTSMAFHVPRTTSTKNVVKIVPIADPDLLCDDESEIDMYGFSTRDHIDAQFASLDKKRASPPRPDKIELMNTWAVENRNVIEAQDHVMQSMTLTDHAKLASPPEISDLF